MSELSGAIADALTALGAASGQTLEYRLSTTGTWTTLVGGFLTYGPSVPIGFDDQRREIFAPETARLKMPAAATPKLLPNTPESAVGYYVRVNSVIVWAVVGMQAVDFAQTIYELRRDEVLEGRAMSQGIV